MDKRIEEKFKDDTISDFIDFDKDDIQSSKKTEADIKLDFLKQDLQNKSDVQEEQKKHINNQDLLNEENKDILEEKLSNEDYRIQKMETKFMSDNDEVIKFDNVSLEYENEIVLTGVNLTICKGEFVYLVGESGAGKSSMIKMIYREIKNDEGTLTIKNKDVTRLKMKNLPSLRRMVGVIFQDYKLLKDKTIFDNVAYALQVTRYPKRKIKARVEYILDKVGILDQKDKYPDELSGGQQQRASIARAIVGDPEILVADEPTGNLDPENALAIMEILETINNEGTTVVMATHDVGIVNNFPKRVVLLGNGSILKETKGEYIYE